MVHSVSRLDLNLVRAFVAIYEAQSVTRAAERLALTQPALSHALSKLRTVYGDPLFVRGLHGLAPTTLADQLYERFAQALEAVESTLEPSDRFDEARSTRRFRIAMSDMGAMSFAYPLLRRLQALAPQVEIEIRKIDAEVDESLTTGRLDAVIGNLPALEAVARSEVLFEEHYACLLSERHPAIGEQLTLEAFAAARHVALSTPTAGNRLVDDALAERGLSRRVVAHVPLFFGLPRLLAQRELLGVVPDRVAQALTEAGGIRALPLPFPLPPFEVRIYWHARHGASAAHRWLIAEAGAALRDPSRG